MDGLQSKLRPDGYNVYRSLNLSRDYFVKNSIRVVFWLTENEVTNLAHFAPDYWAFRHRVVEFVESPQPEQILLRALESTWQVAGEYTDTLEDTDEKIKLRNAMLTELPEAPESTGIRANLLLTLGILHWRKGNLEKALEFLQASLAITTTIDESWMEAACYNAIALVQTDLGAIDAAIGAYQQAIKLTPEHIFPSNNLGNLYQKPHASWAQDASAGTSSAELIQDPNVLGAKLQAITDPAKLDAFLDEQGMLAPSVGDVPVAGTRVRLYARGVGYDLFDVNLFGSDAKEAEHQMRFGQIIYLLSFFERASGGWRRVPGVLAVSTEPESACRPARCPGFFCLDFVEIRKKGENAIVGRTCETTPGFKGGDVEALWIWQVVPSGPQEVMHRPIREPDYTAQGSSEYRLEYRFGDEFPKKLVLRDVSPGETPSAPTSFALEFSE